MELNVLLSIWRVSYDPEYFENYESLKSVGLDGLETPGQRKFPNIKLSSKR